MSKRSGLMADTHCTGPGTGQGKGMRQETMGTVNIAPRVVGGQGMKKILCLFVCMP